MNDTTDRASSPRLLVIEDDFATRFLLGTIFRREGLIVEEASDGLAALSRLRREAWDVVILDLMLPEPNGFEILRELGNRSPELLDRTVVLTAADQRMLRDFSDGARVCRVMRKPFNVEELIEVVLSCPTRGRDPEHPGAKARRA